MARLCVFLTAAVLLGGITSAAAQCGTAPPTKTVTIYNNSPDHTFYAALEAPIFANDMWLQNQFKVQNRGTQVFKTTLLYRIFVNRNAGIPPGGSVTVTVPFYTQLLPCTPDNSGTVNDQFIDWWNSQRMFIWDGKDAADAAFNFETATVGGIDVKASPADIAPVGGAALPAATCNNVTCEPLLIKAYHQGPARGVPKQLVEYTFADAINSGEIFLNGVNYNISAVDSIYLPVAIGAHGNGTAANTYLGSTTSVDTFRNALTTFTSNGTAWPFYVPIFYDPATPNGAVWKFLANPPAGVHPYPEPQIPSANVLYTLCFNTNPPPAPSDLNCAVGNDDSSKPPLVVGQVGTLGQGTLDLWKGCTETTVDTSRTCLQVREVNDFFLNDFHVCFPGKPLPTLTDFLRDIYGWVQFPGCGPSLHDVNPTGYDTTVKTFCELQYNYLEADVPPAQYFNPYTKLIHDTLKSNAYAYSIDDANAYKNLPGDGVIVTIAGANGLENTTQTPLPNLQTYKTRCGTAAGATIIASVLPTARTGVVGGPALTAFAAIINTGTVTATACSIRLPAGVPAGLHYQATDAENTPILGVDVPIDVPAGATQNFVISLTPSLTPFSQDIDLIIGCGSTDAHGVVTTATAPQIPGLTTFLVTISSGAIPDMLSIADTLTHDGITNIPGVNGTGVMAVATENIGTGGGTAVCMAQPTPANRPDRTLAANVSICQTNAQGQCINPATPAASSTVNVVPGLTMFFTVFIQGQGQPITFFPQTTRVFFLCTQNNVPVGETSVAVRTQ